MNEENNNVKKIFGIPCKGCTDRAEILSAGDWRTDALILLAAAVIVGGILVMKYTDLGD